MNKRALICLILIVAFSSSVSGAVCPDVTPLPAISGVIDPTYMAIDSKGNIYISETVNDSVKIYSQSLRLIGRISHPEPLGIAVDDDGLYVASVRGTLTIYSSDLKVKKVVSTGIKYGVSVVVSEGRLYVSNPSNRAINVYDKEGGYLFSIGGDSNFSPIWLTIERTTGNIYAVSVAPAGVYVFGKDGNLIRKFYSDILETAGLIHSPRGIVLDTAGRLYIADAMNLNIQVFDNTGNYVCSFKGAESMNKPGGIVFAGNKVLYVADTEGGKFLPIGIDDYVRMNVTPMNLSFQGYNCGVTTEQKSITISNEGKGVLKWQASSDSEWLIPSQLSGELIGGSSKDLSIQVKTDGLSIGTHRGSIIVSSQGGIERVDVSVEILPPPALLINPSSLSFLAKGSNIPPPQTLTIEISDDLTGQLAWTASSDSQWLKVSPSRGTSNTISMSDVSVDTTWLNGGVYNGTITVSATCAQGSPAKVEVTLTYIKGGTIKVSTNLNEAPFNITGPETYSGAGTSYVVEGVPEGIYTISFGRVMGFKTPSSMSLSVSNGEVIEFIGNYKDLRKEMKIIVTMDKAPESITDEVRVFERDGRLLRAFTLEKSKSNKRFSPQTAGGDIDGDRRDDILVSSIRANDGIITGYRADGSLIAGLRFTVFKGYTAEVSLGDLNGDGLKEIIAGASPSQGNPPEVRVFSFKDSSIKDTGISFLAYESREGVNVTSGDIDGDEIAELLTASGGQGKADVDVRLWKVDVTQGEGFWKVLDSGGFKAGVSFKTPDITTGDINGDGIDEILVSTLEEPSAKSSRITIYRKDGSVVGGFTVPASSEIVLCAGDTDFDGISEIVVGDSSPTSPSRIRVYSSSGSLINEFNAFDNKSVSGVKLSLGEVGE